jgi:hypothetical protein
MNQNNEMVPNFEIVLEKINRNLVTGDLPEFQLEDYFLAIESDLPVFDLESLVTQWHLGIKITSPGVIDAVVGSALPAISLTKVASPYEYNFLGAEFQFFKLDMSGVYWQGINHEKKVAVYVPDSIPFTGIKLLARYTEIETVIQSTNFTITNNLTGEEATVEVEKDTFETPILIGSGAECDVVLASTGDSIIFQQHALLGHMGHHTYLRTKRDEEGKIPAAVNEYGHLANNEDGDRRLTSESDESGYEFRVGHYTIHMF